MGLTASTYGIDIIVHRKPWFTSVPSRVLVTSASRGATTGNNVTSARCRRMAESICLSIPNRCPMKREKASSKKGKRGGEEHRFSAEGDFIERLEGSERRESIPVESVLPRLGVGRDDVVADIGAGIGYFTFPVAREVREVIAIDMEPRMLGVLSERIHKQRVPNVRLLLGEITDLPIADGSVDQVLAAFVYHEVSNQEKLLRECARILRPGGHLTVIEFQKRRTSFGPPLRERKSPEHVLRTAKPLFRLEARVDTEVYYQLNLVKR